MPETAPVIGAYIIIVAGNTRGGLSRSRSNVGSGIVTSPNVRRERRSFNAVNRDQPAKQILDPGFLNYQRWHIFASVNIRHKAYSYRHRRPYFKFKQAF